MRRPMRAAATLACASGAASWLVPTGGAFPRGSLLRMMTADPSERLGTGLDTLEEAAAGAEAAEAAPGPSEYDITSQPGIAEPLGFFDPIGFTRDATEGRIRFYREVELKHGRVAMLAALGFPIAEQFHPLFGGEVDVPSYVAFQETPLLSFWPTVVVPIAIIEIFSVFSFVAPFGGGAPVPVSWPYSAMLLVPPCLASGLTARDLSLANRHRRDI